MWKSEFAAFFLAAFLLTSGSCIGRECHTCDSHSNAACDTENFRPVEIPTQQMSCQESFNKTFLSFRTLFFNDSTSFPPEIINDIAGAGDAVMCAKFTVVSTALPNGVTFRGCSTIGNRTCDRLNFVSRGINATIKSCNECDDIKYCNHGVSVVISYLVAALALLINYKF